MKRNAELDIGDLIEEILSFKEASSGGKRKRIETERSKESKIQDGEISPKSKKRKLGKSKNDKQSPLKKTNEEDKGEADKVNTEDKEKHASPKKPENIKPRKKNEQDEPGKSKKKSDDSVERKKQTTEQMKKKVETEAAISMSMDIVSMASQFAIDIPGTTAQNEQEKEETCLADIGKITQPSESLSCEHVDLNLNQQHLESTPLTETLGLCQRSEESFALQIPTASSIIPGVFIN